MNAPYYQDEYVQLFHGDCREILPTIRQPVCVVTDQPYGTGWITNDGAKQGEFVANRSYAAGSADHPEWDRWSTSWIALVPDARGFAVLGPASRAAEMRAALPAPNQNVWWRKTNPRPLGPAREPICISPAYLPENIEFSAYNGDTALHPNQKPLELMLWMLRYVPDCYPVLDPFAGSGTTLVAAKMLSRPAIGIEGNEAHCRTAVARLSQSVLDFGGAA